jgi:glucose/arabinose dehydrogenase
MGDGGSGGDPQNRAQNLESLLGKMLRIDIDTDGGEPYEIPADNPFVGIEGEDEIWAYGLRNPWKFSFSPTGSDFWIADVGQGEWEEINRTEASGAGLNYGWKCYEGSEEFDTSECSDAGIYTMPIAEYAQTNGRCSVTGGFLYTGETYPSLQNKYVFGDWCSGEIGITDTEGEITWTDSFGDNIYTFGQDMDGELYVGGGETVYRIVDTSLSTPRAGESAFAVYPNPAENEVFIDMKDTADASVNIYDMGGKLLVMQHVSAEAARIDTSALQAGIYVMEIKAGDNTSNQKLVIQ